MLCIQWNTFGQDDSPFNIKTVIKPLWATGNDSQTETRIIEEKINCTMYVFSVFTLLIHVINACNVSMSTIHAHVICQFHYDAGLCY